jgi:hypothetical protein
MKRIIYFCIIALFLTISVMSAQKQGQEKIDSHLKKLRNDKEYTHDYFSQNEKNRDDVAVLGVRV